MSHASGSLFCFIKSVIRWKWGRLKLEAYLTHLAVNDHVAASTQNVALCALLFLYRDVLQVEMPQIQQATEEMKRLNAALTLLEVHTAKRIWRL